MLIITISLALLISGILLTYLERIWDGFKFLGIASITFAVLTLFMVAITLPCQRMETASFERELIAVQQTLAVARAKNDTLEVAAIQIKVASMNQELASYQYYAGIFPLWYPANILAVKPIQ